MMHICLKFNFTKVYTNCAKTQRITKSPDY